jgi:hypothetical protein
VLSSLPADCYSTPPRNPIRYPREFRRNSTVAEFIPKPGTEALESIKETIKDIPSPICLIPGFLDVNVEDGILSFANVLSLRTDLYDTRFLIHRFTPVHHSPKQRVSDPIPSDLPITPK